jgi:ABC-type nitrate/sulfonate/bicarbonate transport system permease component
MVFDLQKSIRADAIERRAMSATARGALTDGRGLDREDQTPKDDLSEPRALPEPEPILLTTRAWHFLTRCLPLLLFFLIWEAVSRNLSQLQNMLPPPSEVIDGGWQLLKDGTLQRDIIASLKRVCVALGFASAIGFPLGVTLGAGKRFAWFVEPIVNFFRPIPPLAWIPLSIIWFGISDAQNQFIIFLGAFFPIVLNTMEGVRDVDRQLIRAARTLGASRAAIALTVVLPAALPSMFVGLRIGTGIAWMALVAGELVAATSGLGFLISQGRLLYRSDFIIVGMLVIGLIGLMLDALIRTVQKLVTPWRADQ